MILLRNPVDVDPEQDPLKYYRVPLLKHLYFKRLKMACSMLDGLVIRNMLDVGYGSGILMPELRSRCDALWGIDTHGKSEQVFEACYREGTIAHLVDGDVTRIPFPDKFFDCITCISVLDHVADIEKAAQELNRVLTIGGHLIVGLVSKNPLTDIGFNLIGADTDRLHVHTDTEVFGKLWQELSFERGTYFAPFIKLYAVNRYMRLK